MIVKQAEIRDIPAVLELLQANHVNNVKDRSNGFVTTNMTEGQLAALIERENGVTIAKEDERVLAFAMAGSWDYWAEWPFFAYMIEQLPKFSFEGKVLTVEGSYQYGPVCIDESVRGTGVFEKVFYSSLASMRARYPVMATFINHVNPRSFAAHTRKVAMTHVGDFQFNGNNYYLMACPTDLGSV